MAALLFKLQACTQLELNKVASTSKLCAWKKSRRYAEPAPLKNIDFRRPKKDSCVPNETKGSKQLEKPYCSKDPSVSGETSATNKLKELRKLAPNAAIFTSILDSSSDDDRNNSETDTGDEDESNCISEPLTSLFVPQAINFTNDELQEHCKNHTKGIKIVTVYHKFTSMCITSASRTWQLQRAGRITASISKQAFQVGKSVDYPKSLMNSVMQYSESIDVAATRYGKRMEKEAKRDYINLATKSHSTMVVSDTGLHVLPESPYLAASPDGLIECKCHGKGVLEIKCPYKYKDSLDGWKSDSNFPVSFDGVIRQNHQYYFQVQHQLLVTGRSYCHFFIWTKGEKESDKLLLTIEEDSQFYLKLQEQFCKVFFNFILPEIVSRKHDQNKDNSANFIAIVKDLASNP